jgi:hypothetical protein
MGVPACAKEMASAGRPGMTKGMQGGNRLYAGSFWHQVRKKPELWVDKSKLIALFNGVCSFYTV